MPYLDIDAIQRYIHRLVSTTSHPDTFIVWEASDTYTAGRRTKPADIPDPTVTVIRMDRGGSVTYHGPGQLVIYPIIKINPPADAVKFVRATESAMIRALRTIGVETSAIAGRSGVWVERRGDIDRKLCAIGIKFSRDTTMHGMAFNVFTDLAKFMRVIPCGLADAGVTSLAQIGEKENLPCARYTLPQAAALLLPALAEAYAQFIPPARKDGALTPLREEKYLARIEEEREKAAHLPKIGIPRLPSAQETEQRQNTGEQTP